LLSKLPSTFKHVQVFDGYNKPTESNT
jgi:hypothetical protein